ncbi:MAG TPA: glycosyltransferase [Dehalococcoidia bacterium]|nr:glycosyltransferase [Dehalococcoidia bacterium]
MDLLSEMPGYRHSRVYLAPSPKPSLRRLATGVARAWWTGRTYQLVHAHGEVAGGLCLPLLLARPSVVTLNGLHFLRRMSGLGRIAAVLNLRAVIRATDRMICVSRAEYEYLLAAVGPVAQRRAVVIHNGVRVPPPPSAAVRAEVRRELGLTNEEPVGIWVGSLDARKDPLSAVRAAEAAALTLLVVGDGPLRAQVEQAAGAHVRVLGHRDDVGRLLQASDIYLMTSTREGLSFALLEAMACGLAPVVSDAPENLEAIGDASFAVTAGDSIDLAKSLRSLAADSRRRRAAGHHAACRISRFFQASKMIHNTKEIYRAVGSF